MSRLFETMVEFIHELNDALRTHSTDERDYKIVLGVGCETDAAKYLLIRSLLHSAGPSAWTQALRTLSQEGKVEVLGVEVTFLGPDNDRDLR